MKIKYIIFSLTILLAIALAGGLFYAIVVKGIELITSTYSKTQIPDTLVEICRRDFDLDQPIKAKIAGNTLITSITIRGLVAPNPNLTTNKKKATSLLNRIIRICKFNFASGYFRGCWIKLTEPAIEEGLNLFGELSENLWPPEVTISEEAKIIVRKFMMAVRRICLSAATDELKFCTYILIDPAVGKMAYTFSIEDLKKVSASWISSIDFQTFRQIHDAALDSKYIGDMLINKLLLFSGFQDKNISWLNMDMKSTSVDSQQRLYHLKSKKDSIADKDTAIYILINTGKDNQGIEGIYEKNELPERLQAYQDSSLWPEEEHLESGLCIGDTIYFLGNMMFPDFFTAQISEMITKLLDFVRKTSEAFSEIYPERQNQINIPELEIDTKLLLTGQKDSLTATTGHQEDPGSGQILQLKLSKKIEDAAILEKLLNLIIWVVKNRCQAYKFYDFTDLRIIDENSKEIMVIPSKQLFADNAPENSVLRFLDNLVHKEKEPVPFSKTIVPSLERF